MCTTSKLRIVRIHELVHGGVAAQECVKCAHFLGGDNVHNNCESCTLRVLPAGGTAGPTAAPIVSGRAGGCFCPTSQCGDLTVPSHRSLVHHRIPRYTHIYVPCYTLIILVYLSMPWNTSIFPDVS